MLRFLIRSCLVAALLAGASLQLDSASAGEIHRARRAAPPCIPHQYGNPDLFYNFYVPPTCGGTGAELYLAPQPVPVRVGHTYYTYQPFMPHEMLYEHHRSYYRYYNGGRGLTRAHVQWYRPQLHKTANFVHNLIKIPR